MKSSSRFFPARLMSAEIYGELAEDVYLIKPNNSPDKSVEIAVTHITRAEGDSALNRLPLVLVHGLYQNKRMWASESAVIAEALIASGFDVWMLELRGHGHSPSNQLYQRNTMADYARYDLPAVNMFVAEQTSQPVNWLGYGAGGGSLLMSLAVSAMDVQQLGHVFGVGVPFYAANWSRVPGVSSLLMARRLRSDADTGPESEPMSLLSALIKENHWFARRGKFFGVDLWAELDRTSASWTWLCADKSVGALDQGFARLSKEVQALRLRHQGFEGYDFSVDALSSWCESRKMADQFADSLIELVRSKEQQNNVLPPRETASPA